MLGSGCEVKPRNENTEPRLDVRVAFWDSTGTTARIEELTSGRQLDDLSAAELMELAKCYNDTLDDKRALEAINRVPEPVLASHSGGIRLKAVCLSNVYNDEPGRKHELEFLERCTADSYGDQGMVHLQQAVVHLQLATDLEEKRSSDSLESAFRELELAFAANPRLLDDELAHQFIYDFGIEEGGFNEFVSHPRVAALVAAHPPRGQGGRPADGRAEINPK
jgi:hypothetical protein